METKPQSGSASETEEPKKEDLPIIRLDLPEAQRFADSQSRLLDLDLVINICDRLEVLLNDPKTDTVIIHSLWIAALSYYARCFSIGVREKLSETMIASVEKEFLEKHGYFLTLRNKHLAHSVNVFDDVAVGTLISPASAPERRVEDLVRIRFRYWNCTYDDVKALRDVTRRIRRELEGLNQSIYEEALTKARTLPIEELLKGERLEVTIPDADQVGKRRKLL